MNETEHRGTEREKRCWENHALSLRKQASLPFSLSQFWIINSQRLRQNDCHHHCGRSVANSLKVMDGKTSRMCRDGGGGKKEAEKREMEGDGRHFQILLHSRQTANTPGSTLETSDFKSRRIDKPCLCCDLASYPVCVFVCVLSTIKCNIGEKIPSPKATLGDAEAATHSF